MADRPTIPCYWQDHGGAGQAGFQIQDRRPFMLLLGLGFGDRVSHPKTIRLFRGHLTQAEAMEKLFDLLPVFPTAG